MTANEKRALLSQKLSYWYHWNLHLLSYILVVSILQLHAPLRIYTPSNFDSYEMPKKAILLVFRVTFRLRKHVIQKEDVGESLI